MKDSEFIELLNLYLDHEISAADAVRLEAEVQGNPARRRLYREYCQMQKACRLLADDYQTGTTPVRERRLAAFEPASRTWRGTGLYATGAFIAAAACVAVVFTWRTADSGRAGSNAVAQPIARDIRPEPATDAPLSAEKFISAGAPRAIAQTVSVPATRDPTLPTFVRGPRLRTGGIEAGSVLVTAVGQGNAQFDWMRTIQLAPLPQRIPPEELRFDVRPVNLRPDARALGNESGNAPAEIEMAAFRFVK